VTAVAPASEATGEVGAERLVAWASALLPEGSITLITKNARAAPPPASRNPATIRKTRVTQLLRVLIAA
jgi:hypothetical protein